MWKGGSDDQKTSYELSWDMYEIVFIATEVT